MPQESLPVEIVNQTNPLQPEIIFVEQNPQLI